MSTEQKASREYSDKARAEVLEHNANQQGRRLGELAAAVAEGKPEPKPATKRATKGKPRK